MRKTAGLFLAAVMGASFAFAAPAFAESGNDDDIVEGPCDGFSNWKIKVDTENNGRTLEIEYEVDQNVVGDTWQFAIRVDGVVIARGTRTTVAPSGSFEVRRLVTNTAGDNLVEGAARNTRTGEICVGANTFNG